MSDWVALPLVHEEAAALRRAGVRVEKLDKRSYRGPAWVQPFIESAPDVPALEEAARAVVAGLDPEAVLAAHALGGSVAVRRLVEAAAQG